MSRTLVKKNFLMQNVTPSSFTASLIKALAFAIGLVFCLWFMYTVINTVLLILLSIITAMLLNAPVTWLQNKRCPRPVGLLIVVLAIVIVLGVMIWLVIPIINMQLKNLAQNLPLYVNNIERKLATWKATYFHMAGQTQDQTDETLGSLHSFSNTLQKLGGFSISLVEGFVLSLLLGSLTIYIVLYPRPLLEFYLSLFSLSQREKATNVFTKTASMLRGWMRANLIGGGVEAVTLVIFLSIMKVPGAWVWGMLAVVAQFFPKIGFYIMSIPPTLVALSLSPWSALWVFVFYLVMTEIAGDFLFPKLRATSMKIHPVAIIVAFLLMGAAFGFVGILLATPVAAFSKAFYEEFYLSKLPVDEKLEERIDLMIRK